VSNLQDLLVSEGPETIATFIARPIQGAGNVIVPPPGYFREVQRLLKKHEIFLIEDEVICGFGRTGRPFGAEANGLVVRALGIPWPCAHR
jgi:adenosylmethionine-8-amino-7-oxononanoate aminotransferase